MARDGPKVANAIRERIGKSRGRAAMIRYMKEPTGQERTRVYIAQLVILITSPVDNLPELFGQPGALNIPEPGSQELNEYLEARPPAIEVLTQALRSKDQFCREGAAYALSICGPDAAPAVLELKAVLADPDELVSKPAAEALKKIEGTQDETQK